MKINGFAARLFWCVKRTQTTRLYLENFCSIDRLWLRQSRVCPHLFDFLSLSDGCCQEAQAASIYLHLLGGRSRLGLVSDPKPWQKHSRPAAIVHVFMTELGFHIRLFSLCQSVIDHEQ